MSLVERHNETRRRIHEQRSCGFHGRATYRSLGRQVPHRNLHNYLPTPYLIAGRPYLLTLLPRHFTYMTTNPTTTP